MKVVKKSEAVEHQNGPACVAIEYPTGDTDMNVATVILTGRYPETGFVRNNECATMAIVTSGSGTYTDESGTKELKEGDMIRIEPGEKYYWNANMTLVMPCAPAWTPEQYEHIV